MHNIKDVRNCFDSVYKIKIALNCSVKKTVKMIQTTFVVCWLQIDKLITNLKEIPCFILHVRIFANYVTCVIIIEINPFYESYYFLIFSLLRVAMIYYFKTRVLF